MAGRNCLRWGAIALSASVMGANAASALDDRAIFTVYDQVNGFDIETASLGVVKGQSTSVRELAAMVLRDHSAVRQMSRDLAQKLGVTYTVPPDDEATQLHAKALAALRARGGAAFDRAYLAHEIEFHRTAIKAVKETLVPAAAHPELRQMMTEVLPGFEQHLAHTLAVATKLGVPTKP